MKLKKHIFLTLFALICINGFAQNLTRLQYINKYKDEAIRQMHKHKIPASITLAQACLESNDGNSTLARKANNHFGIKCHNGWKGKGFKHDDDQKGECFRRYKNAEDSFVDHSYFLISGSRYNSLFDLKITDYKAWAHGLKAAGYATNPKYAQLLIDIIEEYKLYRYDTQDAYKESRQVARIEKQLKRLEKKVAKTEKKAKKANEKLQKFIQKNGLDNMPAPRPAVKPAHKPQPHNQTVNNTNDGIWHTIKGGDTLYSIARKNGTTVDKIVALNPGLKAEKLEIGRKIRIK